jgi:hypothetical protein
MTQAAKVIDFAKKINPHAGKPELLSFPDPSYRPARSRVARRLVTADMDLQGSRKGLI